MNKPISIVFTTINTPLVLYELYKNITRFGYLDHVKVWVVGDLKTPPQVHQLVDEISSNGMETIYLDIDQQDEWGKQFPTFYKRIPYNNETRRNIGYLFALEDGCDILISIDDDNFPSEDDFVGHHLRTGQGWAGNILYESQGFHNVCEYLRFEPSRAIYPRGFPFGMRNSKNQAEILTRANESNAIKIGISAGLWLGDPDVDATTWLNGSVRSVGYDGESCIVLDQSTWSPINTQNTSVVRELIPAYFCIPMGWQMPGGSIQRYGDIWGGYFLQSIIKDTEYYVSIGRPLVNHLRNPHNYLQDLRYEYWGLISTDWLVSVLYKEFTPTESRIVDRIDELSNFLKHSALRDLPSWYPNEMRDFMFSTSDSLTEWAQVCRILGC